MELRHLQEKDRLYTVRENEKIAARYKSAHDIMIEAQRKARPMDRSAIVPLVKGQKMTKAEYMMNRDLLKQAAQIKAQGAFEHLNEIIKNRKVTQ